MLRYIAIAAIPALLNLLPADAAEPNGAITLFEAIEQQLGLKLADRRQLSS
jgi:hypothetical protein